MSDNLPSIPATTDSLTSGGSAMARSKASIKQHPVIVFLTAIVTGFIAGVSAYHFILSVAQLEVVQKDTYIMKSDVVGKVLRHEAIREIGRLIERGEELNSSESQNINRTKKIDSYMLRVHTFTHYLNLPPVEELGGQKYSFVEKRIDHIIRDIPNTGQTPAPLEQKVSRIIGVLQGLRSSFSARFE